jgi:hypothetical protein
MLHHPAQVSTMTALPACRRAPATLPSRRPNLRFSSFQKLVREIPFPFGDSVGAGFPTSSFSPCGKKSSSLFVPPSFPRNEYLLNHPPIRSSENTQNHIFITIHPPRLVPTHKTANPIPACGLFVPHLFFEKQIPFPA